MTSSIPTGPADAHSSSAPTPAALVIGVDAGGTASRALLAGFDPAGRASGCLGRGTAPAGNPASRPVEEAVASVTEAVRTALGAHEPSTVRQVVIGVEGGSCFDDPEVRALFARGWAALGLDCPVEVVGDNVVAFVAGTPTPDGHVVVSGSGAIAAEVAGHALVGMSGGLGWLLGDEGSAFWIGREAARLAEDTDEEAARIVRAAADLLADTLACIRPPGATSPIVLAGSCITGSPLLASTLRARLAATWNAPITVGYDGAAGAAWLAAHRVARTTTAGGHGLAELHALLVAGRTTGAGA